MDLQAQVTQEEKVTSPTSEEANVEAEKNQEVASTSVPVTNGEIISEEPAKTEECKLAKLHPIPEPEPVVEPPKPVVESKPAEVVEPKAVEVPVAKPVEVPETKPVEVEIKPVDVEQKPTEVAEPKLVVEPVIAEKPKEVIPTCETSQNERQEVGDKQENAEQPTPVKVEE